MVFQILLTAMFPGSWSHSLPVAIRWVAMWKAVFMSMGYGEYKMDEEQAYTIGKANLRFVEDKARNGDAEALYLMFYACQMGLEGEAARPFGDDFLKKSADAGFMPAAYDYALRTE